MHGEDFASKRKMRDCLIGRLVVPAHQSKPKLGLQLREEENNNGKASVILSRRSERRER